MHHSFSFSFFFIITFSHEEERGAQEPHGVVVMKNMCGGLKENTEKRESQLCVRRVSW